MNTMNLIPITDITDSRLDVYARLREVQLEHIYEPAPGLFIAESPLVIIRALEQGFKPESLLVSTEDLKLTPGEAVSGLNPDKLSADMRTVFELLGSNVPVYTASECVLTGITGFKLTRGMLCAMKRKHAEGATGLLDCISGHSRIAVLEDVVNPTNVGAIFRSAAALGIDAVLLTASCADPLQRRSLRVSMGNVFLIPWTYLDNIEDWQELLRGYGYKTAAMALSEDSIGIDDDKLKAENRLALIMGSEGPGLKDATISHADYVVKIPMSPGVDSLNVAAASAVAFWEISH